MKKILLIGNGAREHIIAEKLTTGKDAVELYCYGSAVNPGIKKISKEYEVGNLEDGKKICEFALKIKPDFAFIGPDNPIGAGIADELLKIEIKSVAPLKTVAQLESSKSFTRDLVEKYKIPGNPKFKVFFAEEENTQKEMQKFLEELGENYVVKADGLEGGKGVKVSGDHLNNHDEAIEFASNALKKHGRVVIEEKLVGVEFSLMSFVDGESLAHMPPVQDHKRVFDGDKGPNTGGMGSYSDANHLLPFLTEDDIQKAQKINELTAEAIFKETGIKFKGIMFGGFMATKKGVNLIEYNARFGDPEAMNVLVTLKTDFVEICEAIINGELKNINVEFENVATVCKYVVPEGYPDNPRKGEKVIVNYKGEDAKIYFASVNEVDGEIFMSGSRAIAFLATGKTIEEASLKTTRALTEVEGPVFYRKDIGSKNLLEERIEVMKKLRS